MRVHPPVHLLLVLAMACDTPAADEPSELADTGGDTAVYPGDRAPRMGGCPSANVASYTHSTPLEAPVICDPGSRQLRFVTKEELNAAATALMAKLQILHPTQGAQADELCAALVDALADQAPVKSAMHMDADDEPEFEAEEAELAGDEASTPDEDTTPDRAGRVLEQGGHGARYKGGDEPERGYRSCDEFELRSTEEGRAFLESLESIDLSPTPLSRAMNQAQDRFGVVGGEGCWVEVRLQGQAAADPRNILYSAPYSMLNFNAPAILLYGADAQGPTAPVVVAQMSYTIPEDFVSPYEAYLNATTLEDLETLYPDDSYFRLCMSDFELAYDPRLASFTKPRGLALIDPSSREDLRVLDQVVSESIDHAWISIDGEIAAGDAMMSSEGIEGLAAPQEKGEPVGFDPGDFAGSTDYITIAAVVHGANVNRLLGDPCGVKSSGESAVTMTHTGTITTEVMDFRQDHDGQFKDDMGRNLWSSANGFHRPAFDTMDTYLAWDRDPCS